MKSLIALITIALIPNLAFAHCPISLDIHGESYCTNITWKDGEIKMKGQLQESSTPSPYLIPNGEAPQKWIYSKAEFLIWKKGDATHAAQTPKGFRIFPYMMMVDGHHHATSYAFSVDSAHLTHVLSATGLQSMPGCWSLRWTTETDDNLQTSQLLLNISGYTNLNLTENTLMDTHCSNTTTGSETPEAGEHDHH